MGSAKHEYIDLIAEREKPAALRFTNLTSTPVQKNVCSDTLIKIFVPSTVHDNWRFVYPENKVNDDDFDSKRGISRIELKDEAYFGRGSRGELRRNFGLNLASDVSSLTYVEFTTPHVIPLTSRFNG